MKKICPGCGKERDCEQDFNWKYKVRGIRHSRCRYCMSQVSKQHYQDNKQSYMARIHARDKEILQDNRGKLAAYLTDHPCIDCGQTDIRILDLDHVRGQSEKPLHAW
jgi:deoxycytidylate deaminase